MAYRLSALFIVFFLFFACGEVSDSYAPSKEMAPEVSLQGNAEYDLTLANTNDGMNYTVQSTNGETPAPTPSQPKIIYTAAARGRVENLDSALIRITQRITAAGGYLSNQHRTNSNWEHAATLTIRLPAGALSPTLAYLPEVIVELDYQNLDTRDVSAEWLDLESRLQTKRDVRDRYIDILRNKAKKVEDILNAEDKIRVITEEIEAKEGQLRYLRDQVSLSTMTLELYETREYRNVGPTTTRTFGSELMASLANGWELVREMFLGLASIWPLLILGGLGVWFFRAWRGRRAK